MAKVVWLGPAAARSPRLERRSLRCLFSAAHVKKKSSRASGWRRDDPLGQRVHVAGRELAGRDGGPGALLVERQLRGVDVLPLARDDADPALGVVRHRDDPVRLLHDRPRGLAAAAAAARRRRRDEAARPVGVDVEQRVQRDDPLGVRRADLGEVDDDAGLLAPVQAHDPADPLLVDAPARRRREVHAHGRPRARSTPPRGSARSRARWSRRARTRPASRPARAAACGPRRPRPRGRSPASPPRRARRGRRRRRRRCPACRRTGSGRGRRPRG